jgi:hypothetical protein
MLCQGTEGVQRFEFTTVLQRYIRFGIFDLVQFSEEQLRTYYFNLGHYMRFIQGPVLQGENDERWLREAARKQQLVQLGHAQAAFA